LEQGTEDEYLKFERVNESVDNGADMDAPCAANLYIVRLTSFQASAGRHAFDSVNKSLKGKWASLACHETGSLVVQVGPVYSCKLGVPNCRI
jgi:hypothetical protein